jgi:hypothetical protein
MNLMSSMALPFGSAQGTPFQWFYWWIIFYVDCPNWQEALGIGEYWIIDYAAFGGSRHLGKPKQPTIHLFFC